MICLSVAVPGAAACRMLKGMKPQWTLRCLGNRWDVNVWSVQHLCAVCVLFSCAKYSAYVSSVHCLYFVCSVCASVLRSRADHNSSELSGCLPV